MKPQVDFKPLLRRWRRLSRYPDRALRSLLKYADRKGLPADQLEARLELAGLPAAPAEGLIRIYSFPPVREEFLGDKKCQFLRALKKCPLNSKPQPAKPYPGWRSRLDNLMKEFLAAGSAPTEPTTYSCGLFQLHLRPSQSPTDPVALPNPAEANPQGTKKTKTQAPPDLLICNPTVEAETAKMLDRLAVHSGVNRAQAASALLCALDFGPFEAHYDKIRSTRPIVPKHRLQRRIHPSRRWPDVVRLTVQLPAAKGKRLQNLAAVNGLTPAALANLLLEPESLEALTEHRDAGRQLKLKSSIPANS